jgi:hypothetical protein
MLDNQCCHIVTCTSNGVQVMTCSAPEMAVRMPLSVLRCPQCVQGSKVKQQKCTPQHDGFARRQPIEILRVGLPEVISLDVYHLDQVADQTMKYRSWTEVQTGMMSRYQQAFGRHCQEVDVSCSQSYP